MAATFLVREALWRVSSLLNDTDPQFEHWPEIELVQWLNDAHLAIAKFLPVASSRVDSIKLKPGARQSIESIAAADCLPGDGVALLAPILGSSLLSVNCNMGADGSTPGDAIRIVDREVLDVQVPGWRTKTGLKVRAFTYDPNTPRYFNVSPAVPPSPAVWAEVAYNAQPVRIPPGGEPGTPVYHYGGTNAVRISVADEHMDDLVNYTVARARMKNNSATAEGKAGDFVALFVNSINAKVTAITGTNPNLKRLPLVTEPIGAAS